MATVKISRSEKVNNRHENISHCENISVTPWNLIDLFTDTAAYWINSIQGVL